MQLDYLDEISGGDTQFKHDLIKIFLNQMPEFISNMKKFAMHSDYENLAKEAHTAKSSVLVFGMKTTGDTLKRIQHLAENINIKDIDWLINKVSLDYDNVKNKLADIAESLS